MTQAIGRVFRSKVLGFVAIAALAFGLVSLGRIWWEAWPWFGPTLTAVPHPRIDEVERITREQIMSARKESEAILADRRSTQRQRGLAYAQLGKIYLADNFAPAAAVCLRNAAALDRDEFRWPYLLARALMRDGKTQDSAAAMAEAVKRMRNDVTATTPDYVAAMNFLGEAAVRLNKPEEARTMFEAAVQANPNAGFALFRLGQLASRAGDSERAISFLEKSLALMPGTAEIRRQLGTEYRRRGDAANAARYDVPGDPNRKDKSVSFSDPLYSSVLELNQSSVSLNRQGSRKAEIGRWREALALYERGLKANPDGVMVCQNYGQALIEMDRAEEAQRAVESCAAKHPEEQRFRGLLCKAYAAAPATRQKALDIALAMRKEKPGDREALQLLAGVYTGMGRHADALRLYEEAEKMAADESWPLIGQARERAALGQFQDARATLEKALERFPDNSDTKLTLARFLATSPDAKSRDGARAVKMTQQIIAGQYTAIRGETMAVALAETGRFDDAVQAQRKAIATFNNLGTPQLGERLTNVLRSLEARKPWREPWPFKGAGVENAPAVEEPGQ